jgi:hypothetical protein
MTQLFLIHSEQDTACTAQLQHDLTVQGYAIWQGSDWQQGIKESGAVVVVWSAAAAQAASVAEQIERAQWLYKRMLVVAIDGTALPDALARVQIVRSAAPCTDAVAQLRDHLPPVASTPAQPAAASSEATHIFGVRCANGHITYFDKREVCRHDGNVNRSIVYRDNKPRDALHLRCNTCKEPIVVEVDCEGYK